MSNSAESDRELREALCVLGGGHHWIVDAGAEKALERCLECGAWRDMEEG